MDERRIARQYGLAKRLRRQLQRAQQAETEAERRKLSTVAIVEAGPTGTELAATLADRLPQPLTTAAQRDK